MKHFALVLSIAIMLSGCTHAISNEEQINTRGNNVGNIVNFGLVAQQGDWVYYAINNIDGYSQEDTSKYGLYKMNINTNQPQQIFQTAEHYILGINVVGDWVFFYGFDGSTSAYKIRTDGTELIKIYEEEMLFLTVIDDWIYYSNSDDNHRLYKIRTDGTDRTKLNNQKSYSLNVVGDWIYYNDINAPEIMQTIVETGNLFKVRIDGSEKTQLTEDESAWFINVVDDWIYYSNADDNHRLYKIRTDGTDRQLVE